MVKFAILDAYQTHEFTEKLRGLKLQYNYKNLKIFHNAAKTFKQNVSPFNRFKDNGYINVF